MHSAAILNQAQLEILAITAEAPTDESIKLFNDSLNNCFEVADKANEMHDPNSAAFNSLIKLCSEIYNSSAYGYAWKQVLCDTINNDKGILFEIHKHKILDLVSQEPNNENIKDFNLIANEILTRENRLNVKIFNNITHLFIGIYKNQFNDPVWHLLAANKMQAIYSSGLEHDTTPFLEWSNIVTNMPPTSHPRDEELKIDVFTNLGKFFDSKATASKIKLHATQDQNQLIYQNKQTTSELQDKSLASSYQKQVEACFLYYDKALELTESSQESTRDEISTALLNVASVREKYLPIEATLEDEETKKLISALEKIIDLHSNAIESDEKMQERDHEQANALINKTKLKLVELYANLPQSRGLEPNAEIAAAWLGEVNVNDQKIQALHDNLKITEAKTILTAKQEKMAEDAYNKLINLTNYYLEKIANCEEKDDKREIFENLNNILLANPKKKYQALIAYKIALEAADKDMLFDHKTRPWKRFIYDAFSILTVVPMIARAINSRVQYGTCMFWKADSEKVSIYAKDSISKVEKNVNNIRKLNKSL